MNIIFVETTIFLFLYYLAYFVPFNVVLVLFKCKVVIEEFCYFLKVSYVFVFDLCDLHFNYRTLVSIDFFNDMTCILIFIIRF